MSALSLMACGGSVSSSVFDDPGTQGDSATSSDSASSDETSSSDGSSPSDSGAGSDSTSTEDTSVASDTGGEKADTAPPPFDTAPPPPPMDTGTTVACTETGGKIYEGHCYFPINKRTWAVAHDFCMTRGAHLATITSAGESTFVNALYTTDDRWIGLSRDPSAPATASSYQWTTGEAVTFTNWAFGEPNGSGACVRLTTSLSGGGPTGGAVRWGDDSCDQMYYGVCEREP